MKTESFLSAVLCSFVLGLLTATPSVSEIPESMVLEAKKSVVNIKRSVSHALNNDRPGRGYATGFIVDAERGIIATNRHVAGTSPSQVRVTFENGETTEARVLHYDSWHDFGFYRIDLSEVEFPLRAVEFGSSFDLGEQDEVVMIGNNDTEEYSVKFGRVTNLVVDKGERHSATFQTSFDRAGGSSGSPVFDAAGRVVGIHFKGSSTTSFEMRIEYLQDALRQLRDTGAVRRGELGVELELIHLADAQKHFRLPKQVSGRIGQLRPDIKRMIYVDGLIPRTPAEEQLLPGDLVFKIGGRIVGDDLYLFDRIVDEKTGEEVELEIYRNGEPRKLRLPVLDAEKLKVRRFALFAGGVLHDVTPELRREYGIHARGTFLSQANEGTSMSELGYGTERSRTSFAVLIEQINGTPTPDLDAFVRAVQELSDAERIYVLFRNMRSDWQLVRVEYFALDLRYSPLEVFDYVPETLDWAEARP